MTAPIYATESDYRNWVEDQDATISARLLRQASRVVDEILIGAVYDTDPIDQPTDPDLIQAFADATCAQAAWMDAAGDTTGSSDTATIGSASIGSVSYTGASAATVAPAGHTLSGASIAPAALRELRGAGLTTCVSTRG